MCARSRGQWRGCGGRPRRRWAPASAFASPPSPATGRTASASAARRMRSPTTRLRRRRRMCRRRIRRPRRCREQARSGGPSPGPSPPRLGSSPFLPLLLIVSYITCALDCIRGSLGSGWLDAKCGADWGFLRGSWPGLGADLEQCGFTRERFRFRCASPGRQFLVAVMGVSFVCVYCLAIFFCMHLFF